MTDMQKLKDALVAEAEKRGWIVYIKDSTPDSFNVRVIVPDSGPPDLGIHIRDGMGTKDKVGG